MSPGEAIFDAIKSASIKPCNGQTITLASFCLHVPRVIIISYELMPKFDFSKLLNFNIADAFDDINMLHIMHCACSFIIRDDNNVAAFKEVIFQINDAKKINTNHVLMKMLGLFWFYCLDDKINDDKRLGRLYQRQ